MLLIEIDPTKSVVLTSSSESLYSPTLVAQTPNIALANVAGVILVVFPCKSSSFSRSATIWNFPDLLTSTSSNTNAVFVVFIVHSNSSPFTTILNVSIA